MNKGGRSLEREKDSSGRSREAFLGTLRLETWVGKVKSRKGKICSATGLRGRQKQRPRESTVAQRYCHQPKGHASSRNSSWGRMLLNMVLGLKGFRGEVPESLDEEVGRGVSQVGVL